MTGSILQLVAYGIEDIFLTNDPQITYFKVVYKRHTNFSREEIRQNFVQKPNFNEQVSANISKNGDLMEKSYLVITLPEIKAFTDNITKVAWVKSPGYSIIDTISIEINGRQICKHFGEWMYLWNEMFNLKAQDATFKKMIGDVPELTDYSSGKKQYKIYIPLQFWFCRSSANALPLISLQYSDIKINLSLKDWTDCILVTPTHYIICSDSLVNFEDYEYIEQNVDGVIAAGFFTYFDPVTKRLHYTLLTTNNFLPLTMSVINTSKYKIYGKTSSAFVSPAVQNSSSIVINPATYKYDKIKSLTLGDTYLLINYIFIDEDERLKFAQTKHDYIIEQLYFNEYNEVTGPTESIKINIDNPCKLILWVVQQQYLYYAKDYYNYTPTYRHKRSYDTIGSNISVGDPLYSFDSSLVKNETVLLNNKERISYRDSKYFRINQMYNNCVNTPPSGVNCYFFSLDANSIQHSGTCNMSKIERIEVKINTNAVLSTNNIGLFRSYAETYNILRISNGLGAIMFEK